MRSERLSNLPKVTQPGSGTAGKPGESGARPHAVNYSSSYVTERSKQLD